MTFSLLGATLHISPTVHRLSFIPSSPPVAQCLSLARLHDGLCAAQFLRFGPLSCPQRWTECVACSGISELRTFFLAHHWRTCIWKGLRGVQSRRSDGPSRELEILSFAYAAIPESWRIGYKGFRYSWTLTRVSRTIVRVSSLIRIMPCNNVYT
jgi:hypothetical protein